MFSNIFRQISTLFVTVPEFRFFGKIIMGIVALGVGILILKILL